MENRKQYDQVKSQGRPFKEIVHYFVPEFVTALLLYSVPLLIDARFVALLGSTIAYATLGVTNSIVHFMIKIAEGLAVGTVVLTGNYNGKDKKEAVGALFVHSFLLAVFVGLLISTALFYGASFLYGWYEVPEEIAVYGVSFFKIRAISIFFAFLYFSMTGFLRGIKDTRMIMSIFVLGCIAFVFSDYVLIFGKWGFPALGLNGSAYAALIQYAFMSVLTFLYIVKNKKYAISLFSFDKKCLYFGKILQLSWPVVIDKGVLAWSYMWLCKCLGPMGSSALASYSVIKDLERFSIMPAIAFAQVVTMFVSNDCVIGDWEGVRKTIKKIVFISVILMAINLIICSLWPAPLIRFFDIKGEFTVFAAFVFPIISLLTVFDVVQLVLASALRGAGDVKMVMWTRVLVCGGFFLPLAFACSLLPISNQIIKFVLIYGSFYIGNALMSIIYIYRIRGKKWQHTIAKDA